MLGWIYITDMKGSSVKTFNTGKVSCVAHCSPTEVQALCLIIAVEVFWVFYIFVVPDLFPACFSWNPAGGAKAYILVLDLRSSAFYVG